MAGYVEIERKYAVADRFALPRLKGLPGGAAGGEPVTHRLVATYFDTADLRLAAHGITLRRREGGPDAGWHLKIPVAAGAKEEIHAPLTADMTVPAELAALVAARTRGAPLHPVAEIETHRTVIPLVSPDGAVMAEVADDSVNARTLNGTARQVNGHKPAGHASWREVEVELGPAGSTDLMDAVGKRLLKAGATASRSSSKLSQVLPAPPAGPAETPPVKDSAGEAVRRYLREQVEALLALDPKARRAEPDAVHRMRVAVRRLRSALGNHRRLLDPARTADLRAELRWLAAVLGEVRDLEVLRDRFTTRLASLTESAPPTVTRELGEAGWLEVLAREEAAAYARMGEELSGNRYFTLLGALDELVARPPFTRRAADPALRRLPAAVRRSWRRLEKAYAAAERSADPLHARHEARKDAKRARYAAESAVPALGASARAVAKLAENLQEVMGAYQDGVVAQEYLARAADAAAPADRFAIGFLAGIEHAEAEATLKDIPAAWSRTADQVDLAALDARAT